MSDVWVFNTVADGKILAHSVSMPFPDVDTLPPNLIGIGNVHHPEVDADGFCYVTSLTTMSDRAAAPCSPTTRGTCGSSVAAAYQGAEFEADVT